MIELKIVQPNEITSDTYIAMLKREPHGHLLVKDSQGKICFLADTKIIALVKIMGLNGIIQLFTRYGLTKNSEIYRKLYRDMGYSLYGYWEIFYCELNNEDADEYKYSCHKSAA